MILSSNKNAAQPIPIVIMRMASVRHDDLADVSPLRKQVGVFTMAGVALNSSSRRATRLLRKTKRADGYAPPQEEKKGGALNDGVSVWRPL